MSRIRTTEQARAARLIADQRIRERYGRQLRRAAQLRTVPGPETIGELIGAIDVALQTMSYRGTRGMVSDVIYLAQSLGWTLTRVTWRDDDEKSTP